MAGVGKTGIILKTSILQCWERSEHSSIEHPLLKEWAEFWFYVDVKAFDLFSFILSNLI